MEEGSSEAILTSGSTSGKDQVRFIDGERRGGKVLVFENNIYHVQRRVGEWTTLRCCLHKKRACRATLRVHKFNARTLTFDKLEVIVAEHNRHGPSIDKTVRMEGEEETKKLKVKEQDAGRMNSEALEEEEEVELPPLHVCLFCCHLLPDGYGDMAYLENKVPAYLEGQGERLRISLNDPVKNSEAFSVLCARLGVPWRSKRETFDPSVALPLCLKCQELHQTLFQLQLQIGQLEKLIERHAGVIRTTIRKSEEEKSRMEGTGSGGGGKTQLRLLGLDVFRKKALSSAGRELDTRSGFDKQVAAESSLPQRNNECLEGVEELNCNIVKQEVTISPAPEDDVGTDDYAMSPVEAEVDSGDPDANSGSEPESSDGDDDEYTPNNKRQGTARQVGRKTGNGTGAPVREYPCHLCPSVIIGRMAMLDHYSTKHPAEEVRYSCKVCKEHFLSRRHCIIHQRTHRKPRIRKPAITKCHLCWEILPAPKFAETHFQDKHPDHSGGSTTCRCGKVFKQYKACFNHALVSHSDAPKSFVCDQCPQMFHTALQLKGHRWRRHVPLEQRRQYVCDICGLALTTSSHLSGHMRTHAGIRRGGTLEGFVCESCGKSFAHKGGLMQHTRLVHLGIRDHECEICGKAFLNSGDLERHSRSHTGQRPFPCRICGKGFPCRGGVARHVRNVHGVGGGKRKKVKAEGRGNEETRKR